MSKALFNKQKFDPINRKVMVVAHIHKFTCERSFIFQVEVYRLLYFCLCTFVMLMEDPLRALVCGQRETAPTLKGVAEEESVTAHSSCTLLSEGVPTLLFASYRPKALASFSLMCPSNCHSE
ncbi:hypothetical protein TRVL_02587 [Trypanosoma vivax]|nr:hypothetical protein TRVL_02587 [Trypanosoma vivax]